MVSSTITLDKKSSSSSSSTAAASASAQQQASSSAEQNNIISIPLNATTTTSNNGDALNLSEQKISILFPKCKPRTAAEQQHYSGGNFASVVNNNSSGGYGMSTTATNSKSDTSSSLTTPTSLTSSSYKPYGAAESGTMRGAGVSGSGGSGYDLLKSDSSSRINNNPYEGGRLGRHATSSVDKYSFYYNNQPPPLSTSPTENNANNATAASQFLPTDDEEEEEDLRKSSYPQSRHSYYTSRQSHYYNLPKQDPAGTPSNVAPSRYHWDLSYSQPVASTQSSSSAAVKHASLKSTYSKVLQSPLEDESDIEDKLKYFNYQNEMHNSSSSTAIKAGGEKPSSLLSGIYSNYKTNEMIVFSDIDEERRRVQQQEAGTGLHVSAVDNLNDGVMAHNQHHYQQQQQMLQQQESNDGVVASGGSSSKNSSSVLLAGKMEESSGNAHKSSMANNSGSNIMAIKTKRTKSAGFKEAVQQIEDFIANPEYSAQLFTCEFDNRPETDVEFNKLRETEQDNREDDQED